MRKAIRRGDLFYADLNPVVGSEQGGIRPVLVIQNDVGNHFIVSRAPQSLLIPETINFETYYTRRNHNV